uniref:Uncharacterized protein n=1 Tax=Meloidogyne enterolobii TaxID=390850 RepID=A0A6V7WUB3_MELEN|nr:unnamed protein product [Meloidogyne enterolobii]
MKINFYRYLFMMAIASLILFIYTLNLRLFILPYAFGGVKYFDNFNKTLPYIQFRMETMSFFSFLPIDLVEIFSYLIIFICGYKMVKYVNLNNNFDGNTKALNKLLTKVLIILAAKPFVEQA